MKQFLTFVRKEFAHVLRDKRTLLILFGIPVIQILIFGFALTNEIKNARIVVLDHARDEVSARLTQRIAASRYFDIDAAVTDLEQVTDAFRYGKVKLAVIFPANMARDLNSGNHAQVQIIADASDPNTAHLLATWTSNIIRDYVEEVQSPAMMPFRVIPEVRMMYNPQLKGAHNFVPGVMALVLMLVCVLMTAISIVREKETGTMEVLLVSPFKPILVIISKTIPYLILSLVNLTTILLLSIFVLDLPVNGSLLLLFAESILFIITCLTFGVFISVKTRTQQMAMMIALLGMLLPTILFSGFIFPVENMPYALQLISNIIPARWFYIIIKSIMIKGLGMAAIWKETLILLGMALFLLAVSLRSFKIRLA